MLRCNSPSPSELKEISEEKSEETEEIEAASETEDSLAQASEVAGTEEGWSELIGNKGVEESSASELIGKGRYAYDLVVPLICILISCCIKLLHHARY